MAELQKNLTDWKPWAGLFILGIVLGIVCYQYISPMLTPFVFSVLDSSAEITSEASPLGWLSFYIFKNGLVGLLCVLTGRITRGIYPLMVIMINSVLVGSMALLVNDIAGVSVLSFFLGIAPHGFVEIFAICLSCAIGMQPGKLKEKLIKFTKPLGLLVVAAIIETFVSPLVVAYFA